MPIHPDVAELVDALENASEDVTAGVDAVVAEGLECDIQRLNYAVADIDREIEGLTADTVALMGSHTDLHKAYQSQSWTVSMLCITVLMLSGLELARGLQWL